MAFRVAVVPAAAVDGAVGHAALVLGVHGHLVVGGADGREAVVFVLGAGCGEEVDDETCCCAGTRKG